MRIEVGSICVGLLIAAGCQFDPSGGATSYIDEDSAPPAMPDTGLQAGPDAAVPTPDAAVDVAPLDAAPPPDAPPPDAIVCASGDGTAVSDDGHCYVLFLGPQSWHEARALCAALGQGSHLVTIADPAELAVVRELVGARRIWIGGSDLDDESVFAWVTDEPFDFTHFAPDEPNGDGDEDCLELRGDEEGQWNDTECVNRRAYMCEQE